ncbi:hypothetical protein MUP00_00605, partial [Candidatus Bathyarchaeota archaeon]|nr:hypothetical protein [Candidatus Bathyarchaeota archaeon]
MKIDSDDYLHVVRAIHLYQQALLTYRQDVGLAYSLLVASAETMAHRFVPKKTIQTDFTLVPGYQGWLKL